MISRIDIANGTATIAEIKALQNHNSMMAGLRGLALRWYYKNQIYYGIIKKGKEVIYEKHYYDYSLVDAHLKMHFDFQEYLKIPNKR